jgi:ATP-dependent helicase/nuclease subunit B
VAELADRPEIAALWLPRVHRMVAFVIDELDRQPEWNPVAWEKTGKLSWRGVTLTGRVDRIDSSGVALRILDYKTGRVPAPGEVANLYQTQLALLAAMAEKGEFRVSGELPIERLDYLKLSGGTEPGEMKPALGRRGEISVETHLQEAFDDFTVLVEGWLLGDRPFKAKQHMVYGRRFRDFDHLARVAEWLGR